MSSVSFDTLAKKFEVLPEQSKEEALDFIEFLLQEREWRNTITEGGADRKNLFPGMSLGAEDYLRWRMKKVRKDLDQWQPETGGPKQYHDLDYLAGTWSEDDVNVFNEATEHFRGIDEELWK